MPVDLTTPFKRLLNQIVIISQEVRSSALEHANDHNFDTSETLRRQLETIRTSADAILETFAKASLTSYTLDDRITSWLTSGEPHSCLETLKEMGNILAPVDQLRHAAPSKDQLTEAMMFFEKHGSILHFLLTPEAWRRNNSAQEASRVNTTNDHQENGSSMTIGYERGEVGFPSGTNRATITAARKKEFLRQKLDEISRWLSPMECTQKHKDTLRLRQEGTCRWFPDTEIYGKWRAHGSRFLWLHGKAGCGKSVLIASTIEHLKLRLDVEEVVIFFYFDFQNKRSTSATELMRSLLSQLLRQIRDHGVDPGDFPDKILKQKSEGTLSLDDLGKLCGLVSRAASYFRFEPMIVIDALDECVDIEVLLPVLVTLSQANVRLLVTSRPDEVIMGGFAGLRSLSFENVVEELASDISLHVRRELDSHKHLRAAIAEMKVEIDTKLTEGAEGRFRWAQCQLDSLKRCDTKEELREALDSLPNELEATYERILGVIDERKLEGKLARRVLVLLMVAIEPLRLTQIVDGLSMNLEKRENDHAAQQWLETKLLHSLSSLVVHHEETDTLSLAHYSVKEYLTSRSALPMYQIVTREAHAEAAQMCMGYISVFLKQESSRENLELWDCFPMLSYALSSGFYHLAHVDSGSTVALKALQSLGSDVRHHPLHWDRLCELREEVLEWPFTPWPSSKHDFVLYILIAYSSPELLRTFLSNTHSLRLRIKTTPLVYAADLRQTEHAMVLLDFVADMNARSLVIDDSHLASPLEVAIDLGDGVLVGELLSRECAVTSELLATAVCMPWCSSHILVKLMQTDEFAEWALNIGDEKLYRGVFNSARPNAGDDRKIEEDCLALARRLRQFGLDLSPESQFGKDLIERALHAGRASVLNFLLPPDQPPPARFLIIASTGDTPETVPMVQFLLQRRVDVHAISDEGGDTALHLAAMCPWEPRSLELTTLLMDAGCNPHTINSDGDTSLAVAARYGHCSVVEFLLSRDVPLPPDILHIVLERDWNHQMIELLIVSGANIHAVSQSTGDTILHRAITGPELDEGEKHEEFECLNVVKRFIGAGCDPTTCNFNEKTALQMAIELNFTSVVEFLLSPDIPLPRNILRIALDQRWTVTRVKYLIQRGVDLHFITSSGDSVLHLALTTYCGEEESYRLVNRLINCGCDPTLANSAGKTVLEMALERRFSSVVDLLLSPGVPLPPDVLLIMLRHHWTLGAVEPLLQRGVDLHATTSNGDTALHLAITEYIWDNCPLVKQLLNAGCDPSVRNLNGETALEIAIKRKYPSVVKLLYSCTVPLPPDILLIVLKRYATLEMVEALSREGAGVHSATSSRGTMFHITLLLRHVEWVCRDLMERFISDVGRGSKPTDNPKVEFLLPPDVPVPPDILSTALSHSSTPEVVESLIRRGALVHFSVGGDTVLRLAAEYYDEEECLALVKRIMNVGYDPSTPDPYGELETPLEIAIEHGYSSVVKLLLSSGVPLPPDILPFALQHCSPLATVQDLIHAGADVHATTSNGGTVLHLALAEYDIEEECSALVSAILHAGCNPTARRSDGKTVLELAIERGYASVVDLLLPSYSPLSGDMLRHALRRRCRPQMIQLLVDKGGPASESDWDTLHQLARASYTGGERQQIIEVLEAACKAKRICPSVEDEADTHMHVTKRARLG